MNLNCKPGDLAVIINAGPDCRHLIGRIVRVRKAHHVSWLKRGQRGWTYYGKRLHTAGGGYVKFLNDVALRPIRDQPGQDETLRIAGLPAPVQAPATGPLVTA